MKFSLQIRWDRENEWYVMRHPEWDADGYDSEMVSPSFETEEKAKAWIKNYRVVAQSPRWEYCMFKRRFFPKNRKRTRAVVRWQEEE